MNRVLVIGVTGNVGDQVLSQLVTTGARVRALTRNPGTAGLPPEVEVGQEISRDQKPWIDACPASSRCPGMGRPGSNCRSGCGTIRAICERFVFLSLPLKTAHPFFQQPNPSRGLAEHMERLIESSGLQWSFLRPGMFAGDARRSWGAQIRAGDVVCWPYLSVPTAPIDERDIAAAAVRALREEGHTGAEYVLTGPQSLSQFEQVATIGRMTGRSLRIEQCRPRRRGAS